MPDPLNRRFDVLAFGAHPDDLEVVMGGTIIKVANQGLSVLFVDLCEGEPARHAARGERHAQALKAALILGVERITLNLQDRGLSCSPIRFSAIRTTRRRRCNRQWSRSFRILRSLRKVTSSSKWAMRVIENEAKMYRRKRRQHLYESLDQSWTEALDEKPFYPK